MRRLGLFSFFCRAVALSIWTVVLAIDFVFKMFFCRLGKSGSRKWKVWGFRNKISISYPYPLHTHIHTHIMSISSPYDNQIHIISISYSYHIHFIYMSRSYTYPCHIHIHIHTKSISYPCLRHTYDIHTISISPKSIASWGSVFKVSQTEGHTRIWTRDLLICSQPL